MGVINYLRMQNVSWVVHEVLERSVGVWEDFCAAAKPHVSTEVVPPFCTVISTIAHNASLNGDSLAFYETFYT